MSGHSKALNCFSFIQQTTYGGVLGDTRLSLRLGKYHILDYEKKIFYFYSAVGRFLVIYPLWFLKDQMVDSGPFQKLFSEVQGHNTEHNVCSSNKGGLANKRRSWLCSWGVIKAD